MTPTPVEIIEQGAPIVHADSAYVAHRGDSIAAIVIDLESKRCEVQDNSHDGQLHLYFYAGEDSHPLKEDVARDVPTGIALPEFAGWRVWLAEVSRYTLRVCVARETT